MIEARWPEHVDLQREPALAHLLAEAIQLPALGTVLAQLNSVDWPVWTSKCDLWPVTNPDEFDVDELDAPAGSASSVFGCYIDLLPKSNQQWIDSANAARSCKHWCALLHEIPLRACRIDFVIRRAFVAPDLWNHGVTVYFTASGETAEGARIVLQRALAALTHVLRHDSTLQ